MRNNIKFLCLFAVLILFVVSFSGESYAWEERLYSGWFGAATGCVTVKIKEDHAPLTPYSKSGIVWYEPCYYNKGTHKFDFKGDWILKGDHKSEVEDVRYTGGGCGYQCLTMHN